MRTFRPALPPSDAIPRARLALVTVADALLIGACTPAGGGASPATGGQGGPGATDAGAASPAASGAACDATAFPGWPRPGQVTTSGIIPVLASSEKVVGKTRLLFVLVDQQNRPIANDALDVRLAFFDLCADPANPTEVLTPAFEWGIVGQRAFYVVTADLARSGPWGAAVAVHDPATGTDEVARIQFSVSEGGFGPRVGDPAPAVRTKTLADVGGNVRQVSSDPQPDPTFYETSLDAALAAKEPFVLAFITPAFCTSAQCGPTMDVLKKAVKDAPIRVVAVEPYELVFRDGRLQPVLQDGSFVPVAAANAYGIPTEPWIFVVGGDGIIAGSFEAVVGERELADAIRAVTK